MSSTIAFIQARMSSTRLPGKVLKKIAGRPMLERVVSRTRRSKRVDEVWVVTSDQSADDELTAWCKAADVPVVRGALHDVLARFAYAASQTNAVHIVRITADCPLIDPVVIDDVIEAYHQFGVDYAANRLPSYRTFPVGLDVEVFSRAGLVRADTEATKPYQREHVTPFFYDGGASCTVHHHLSSIPSAGGERWTVDTPEDLEFIRELHGQIDVEALGWMDVLKHIDSHPALRDINANVTQRSYLTSETT